LFRNRLQQGRLAGAIVADEEGDRPVEDDLQSACLQNRQVEGIAVALEPLGPQG
jgi:hypothetical protein